MTPGLSRPTHSGVAIRQRQRQSRLRADGGWGGRHPGPFAAIGAVGHHLRPPSPQPHSLRTVPPDLKRSMRGTAGHTSRAGSADTTSAMPVQFAGPAARASNTVAPPCSTRHPALVHCTAPGGPFSGNAAARSSAQYCCQASSTNRDAPGRDCRKAGDRSAISRASGETSRSAGGRADPESRPPEQDRHAAASRSRDRQRPSQAKPSAVAGQPPAGHMRHAERRRGQARARCGRPRRPHPAPSPSASSATASSPNGISSSAEQPGRHHQRRGERHGHQVGRG